MEKAFAAGKPPVGIGAEAHAAALAWIPPGVAAFDAAGRDVDAASDPATATDPATAAEAADSANGGLTTGSEVSNGRDAPSGDSDNGEPATEAPSGNGQEVPAQAADGGETLDVPAFLRHNA